MQFVARRRAGGLSGIVGRILIVVGAGHRFRLEARKGHSWSDAGRNTTTAQLPPLWFRTLRLAIERSSRTKILSVSGSRPKIHDSGMKFPEGFHLCRPAPSVSDVLTMEQVVVRIRDSKQQNRHSDNEE